MRKTGRALLFLLCLAALARAEDDPAPLPPGALSRYGATWLRQTDTVLAQAISKDGSTLVTGGRDGKAFVWDLGTRKLVRALDGWNKEWVRAVAISPDGKRIAVGGGRGARSLGESGNGGGFVEYDAATGKVLVTSSAGDFVVGLAYSQDGEQLAVADFSGRLALAVSAASAYQTLHEQKDTPARGVSFAPDGRTLAGASASRLMLFDPAKPAAPRVVELRDEIFATAFSPDGKSVVATVGNAAVIVDVATAEVKAKLAADEDRLLAVAWSPDGTTIATGGKDRYVRLWDAATVKERVLLARQLGAVEALAFSPDSSLVYVAAGISARSWSAKDGKEVVPFGGHDLAIGSVAYLPDGRLAIGGYDQALSVWDPKTRASGGWFSALTPVRSIAVAAVGTTAVVGFIAKQPGDENLGAFASPVISQFDLAANAWRPTLPCPTEADGAVAYSPDARTIAVSDARGEVSFLDTETGEVLRRSPSKGESRGFAKLAWSPLGETVAVAAANAIRIVRAADAQEVRALEGHERPVRALAFAPGGKTLVSCASDGTLRTWELGEGKAVRTTVLPANGLDLAFSPDGKRLAVARADSTVRVLDAATGKETQKLAGHFGAILCVAFSPDGKTIATGSSDTTVLFWTVE